VIRPRTFFLVALVALLLLDVVTTTQARRGVLLPSGRLEPLSDGRHHLKTPRAHIGESGLFV
jgi:hypothetical protein